MSAYEYDIFILHPSQHNSEQTSIAPWALEFSKYLDIMLNQLLDVSPTILINDDLKAREKLLNLNRHEILSKTALVLVLIDQSSYNNQEFNHEIEEVYQVIEQQTNETNSKRIFKLEIEPVETLKQNTNLQSIYGHDFYEINPLSKKAHTIELTNDAQPEGFFWIKLLDLANDIVKSLHGMQGRINAQNKTQVYLGHTTPDQKNTFDILKREFEQQGYLVVPGQVLPNNAPKFKETLEQYLANVQFIVLIIGSGYGEYVLKSEFSYQELQYRVIKEYLDKQPGKQAFIFKQRLARITDGKQSLFIERLKKDLRNNIELIESNLYDFQEIVFNTTHTHNNNPPKPNNTKYVYIIHDFKQNETLEQLSAAIKALGYYAVYDTQSKTITNAIHTESNNINEASHIIIIDNKNSKWLKSKTQLVLRSLGTRHSILHSKTILYSHNKTKLPEHLSVNFNYLLLNNKTGITTGELNKVLSNG